MRASERERARGSLSCSNQSTMINESGHCYAPVLHLSTEIIVLTNLVVKSSDMSKYQKTRLSEQFTFMYINCIVELFGQLIFF